MCTKPNTPSFVKKYTRCGSITVLFSKFNKDYCMQELQESDDDYLYLFCAFFYMGIAFEISEKYSSSGMC